MQVRAPAKINLSFRILGRRADGFHEIETLMAPISLHDVLTIEPNESIEFTCDDPSQPSGDDNLVVKAARRFGRGARIHLEKRIPHGAGLGGGSSDAASVLLALNAIYKTNLPREALAEVAAEIGSDLPFFVFQSAARCSGRGELVVPTRLTRAIRLLLLKPSFGVPTPWAYSRWTESRELPGINYAAQEFAGVELVNDLERPVFEKFVFLPHAKTWLLEQPEVGAALMSGSGSTVLAVLCDGADPDSLGARAKSELDEELWTCACQTV
ncbi:MAG TPA: 4-(cytidine 5'-diphospho)-2-C-methyl-D-erythritol kinase [Chthoniobacterales bacterium]